ncbi:interactor of constitutive active ROPs 3-like isoform X1 [Pistacia vera]|uniref:interactor of constitutive active ROPs 3-like isoform X1 n=1 Tax=Pistacia vera TaxID=55513 RepID=UPI0012637145|nr:interactor of constitutive active ROPs 3-like isoform X1 [Pistacia vera]XP_031280724.1 interactor of constitutive active ROPs 3-like isoform X1 [Pistacia vera]XP_031280725.1 interactor of constitutive active ROPs 3-like isoform X1 [Pistacia vera]XP_031280726.1 interactor of constitutive active ROPs 3-like isoform X1 [Pistacia vera]XP_031280727.1 interactor of constitutive active ROPs 3-like isoform X1 [Pistacia vera]XP_031280728.1 interactor of constitutive active ROPs 3-like isoform X1 [Pi
MQTPKTRSGSSEVPLKVSPRAARQLNTTALESKSASSSSQTCRTPKERSPKVVERRTPRSPVAEKKRPSRISELESQISQLQEDLKKAKDQLSSSESCKNQAQQDAEDSKKQLLAMSSKLEESQKQLLELSASEEASHSELQKTSQEQDQSWQSELEGVQKQHLTDSAALASALNEIQQLKAQLEMVAESEAAQSKHTESAPVELQSLKGNLIETLSLVENMKNQLRESKESETQAHAMASETLVQLETAKKLVEALKSDGMKANEAYNSIASELDQSRARVNLLEGLVSKLEADLNNASRNLSQNFAADHDPKQEIEENQKTKESKQLEEELHTLKSEVERLRTALEISETKFHEEQIQSTVQIKSAYELVDQIKSRTGLREAELEAELEKTKSDIEELKANLMDKETELQGISEENEGLHMKLDKNVSCQRTSELENDLRKHKQAVADLKANLMDKETELQNISEENEKLKLEVSKRETDTHKVNIDVDAEVAVARAAEREALIKLGLTMEEADKSNRRTARVTEQLEAAQAANAEAEAELRRLKVQSDQWRKAAEAAAAMLSGANNGKFMDRSGSLDSNYNHVTGKISPPFSEDIDDDLLKKKNGNVLKKIGVLWKKPQK